MRSNVTVLREADPLHRKVWRFYYHDRKGVVLDYYAEAPSW